MNKKIYIIIISLFAATQANAQQLSLFSQYMQNAMLVNPANTGLEENTNIRIGSRQQWVGFDNAPKTYFLGVNSRLHEEEAVSEIPYSLRISRPEKYEEVFDEKIKHIPQRHGLGAYGILDQQGAFQRIGGYLSYAYHLPLGETYNLSFGVAPGIANQSVSSDGLTAANPQIDQTYQDYENNDVTSTYFDLNAGINFYSDQLLLGYSARQLVQNQMFSDVESGNDNRSLALHHSVLGMYRFNVSQFFELAPSFMFRGTEAAPLSYNVSAKVRFKEKVWGGFSYREEGTLSGMLGFQLNQLIYFSYSYDFTTSDLASYNDGSHEINISFMLNNPNNQSRKFLW